MKYINLFVFALCFFTACESESGFKNYESTQSFFSKEGVQTQKFSANSSAVIQFTTAKGNKVIFQPNAFVTMDNIPVNGLVDFEIKEITEVDEMILSNMPTMSEEGILESGGEFFVRASQNGKKLKLAPNKVMRIEVADVNIYQTMFMQVYNGKIKADNSVMWTLNKDPLNNITVQTSGKVPTDSSTFMAIMNSDSLNWVNIDKLASWPNITYTIKTGNTPDPKATMVFLHFTGRKSVVLYDEALSNKMIEGPATVIGLCLYDNKLYASFLPINMEDKGSSTLNFAITTEVEFKNRLRLLK